MPTTQRCSECDARIASTADVEFVEWETADIDALSFKAPKIMYLAACTNCEAAIGGGVAAGK
ncbi:hypothetical protein EGH22_12740 [Halomicroarcula sp. F28]|uniref:hypothetical protein n=1 Tax=Haloarcula salinisoli TaxID=2487746 RepID=UPI001C73A3FC|nr:hypothetical protein [Halomicroarcula salinisoli]MBX0287201.1 hypothetical protein [Halomicroarcula salinisoli]